MVPDPVVFRKAHAYGPAGLRHAVAFQQPHADAVKEVGQFGIHWSAAGNGALRVRTENGTDPLIDQLLVHSVSQTQAQRRAHTGLLHMGPFASDLRATGEQLARNTRTGTLGSGIVDLLEYTRHGKQQGRTEPLEILDNGLHARTQSKCQRAGIAEQRHITGEHVTQRQEQQ